MSDRYRKYDESQVRVRPNRRGTRPRTKDRPAHADAIDARVIQVDRGRYRLDVEGTPVNAMKARELGRTSAVVGDIVNIVGDTSGAPGTLARIVRVAERTSVLRRTADDTDPVERVIVANADQLGIVTALRDPQPRGRMIDRCIVAAYDAGLEPILVLTKADLVDPSEFLAQYQGLQVRHVVTTSDVDHPAHLQGLDQLRSILHGHRTVLVGHSGVGKSTLVNALVPHARRSTGAVNDVTGRGRHTSTNAIALPLPNDDGWVIDTPGVRSFGLAHVDTEHIVGHFTEFAPALEDCPRGCTHDEEECGLDAWAEQGKAGAGGLARLDSLRRLLRARAGEETTRPSPEQSGPEV